jgi:lysophospholipase L1-like esterase
MSKMKVFVNYMRSDGTAGAYHCDKVTIDPTDSNIMHFDWTISDHVTACKGTLIFLVCIKNVEADGTLLNHWNSERNSEMTISEGLEADKPIIDQFPDIITQLLVRMDVVEGIAVVVTVERMNLLEARMNTFASLPNGSTSGNAELADISVGADGKVYPNAGEAVRGQVGKLSEDIDELKDFKTLASVDIGELIEGEFVLTSNGEIRRYSGYVRTDYICIDGFSVVKTKVSTLSQNTGYAFYSANKAFISGSDFTGKTIGDVVEIPVPTNAVYFVTTAFPENNAVYLTVEGYIDVPGVERLRKEMVDKNGTNQVTPENAAFIEKIPPSVQMLDKSAFIENKAINNAYGADINDLVDDPGWTTCNIIDLDGDRKTIALNIGENIVLLTYIEPIAGSYTRRDYLGASDLTKVGEHWEITFNSNIVKVRFQVATVTLNAIENPLVTYADEWEGAETEYRPNTGYKLSSEIKVEHPKSPEQTGNAEPFEGKSFCGIGDSIMQGVGDGNGGFLRVLQDKYPSISVHNMGVGSTTMAQNASVPANVDGKCILDRMDDIPDGHDYIILEGGLNDFYHKNTYSVPFGEYESNLDMMAQSARWNASTKTYTGITTVYSYGMSENAELDTTTFCGAFEAALAKLVVRFYDKKYGVVIPHNARSTSDIDEYLDAEVRLCAKYGVPCLDLRKTAGMPRIYSVANQSSGSPLTVDAVHPNYEGYRLRYLPPLIAWLRAL